MNYRKHFIQLMHLNVEIYPTKENIATDIVINTGDISYNSQIINYCSAKFTKLFDPDIQIFIKELSTKIMDETFSESCQIQILDRDRESLYNISSNIEKILIPHYNSSFNPGSVMISNNVSTDPRIKDPKDIDTNMYIPIIYENEPRGCIVLANSKEYTVDLLGTLIPFKELLEKFVFLIETKKLEINRDIKMKKEVMSMKDSFIATMSHEIRTPLNGVVGMARLLSDSELSKKQQKYVKILADCCTQLMELVNDILDFGKITSEDLVLHSHSFELEKCVNSAVEIIYQRAHDKGLELNINISSSLPKTVTGDSTRLKQVIINLLTNAIKFTERGGIDLNVDIDSEPINIGFKRRKRFVFKVKDTGIGIDKKDQSKIFEVFTKLSRENDYTSTTPGVGMGLAISKYIVQAMDGEITVDSDGVNGSVFTFTVLLDDETDMDNMVKEHHNKMSGCKAIIVDDVEDNRIYLMETLSNWDIQTVLLGSARETISYVSKNPNFDFAIIDVCMPNMSGIELTQTLRQNGHQQPIIGLSSIGSDLQGRDWFDYFNTKPISKLELFNLVLCCLNKSETDSIKSLSSPDQSDEETLKIIIAEDDYYNQVVLTDFLESLGYFTIKVVGNGQACIDAVKKERYDICFMDIKMPIMDGLEATRIIKSMKKPPCIIAITASVQDSDKNRCFAAGMDGYLSKPIQKDQLNSVLDRLSSNKCCM